MKQFTKTMISLFGEYTYLIYLDLREKYLPSKMQSQIKEFQENEKKKRHNFYSLFIQPGDLCFDIGANMGNRTEIFLDLDAKVIAVEPQNAYAKYLKYKFGRKIRIVPKGICSNNDIHTLYLSNSSMVSSFSTDWINSVKDERFSKYNWDKKVDVEMTTLDELIDLYGKPDFIKIDVEGFELEVLRGLTHAIKMISFEYTVPEQTNRVIECIDQYVADSRLFECNYCIGESMNLIFPEWVSADEMKENVFTTKFLNSSFGDIYIRKKELPDE